MLNLLVSGALFALIRNHSRLIKRIDRAGPPPLARLRHPQHQTRSAEPPNRCACPIHHRLTACSETVGLEPTDLSIARMAPATPPHPTQRQRRGSLAVLGARGNATLAVGARGSPVAARGLVAGGLVVVVVGAGIEHTNLLYITNQTAHPHPTPIILTSASRRVG